MKKYFVIAAVTVAVIAVVTRNATLASTIIGNEG